MNKELDLRILTKFDLVTRDIELFKQFKSCKIGLTITSLDEDIQKKFEPFTASPGSRLNSLKELKKAGITTYAFIGPILPYITDLKEIFKRVSPYVDYFKFEDLNMSPCKSDVFKTIRKYFPDLEEK